MDVGVQVEGGMRMSYDPDTVYENLKISVEMMGLRMPTEMELYILQEEDKVACYSNMGGSWLRSEVDAALQNDGSASAAIWNLPPEQLSIDLRRRQHPGYLHRDTSITQEEVQELLDQVHRYQPPAARQEMADLRDKLEV